MNKRRCISNKNVSDILRETGQEHSFPINLNKILRPYGISAQAMDFSPLESKLPRTVVAKQGHIYSALITSETGNTTIFYSNIPNRLSDYRYKFAVAHEIAHICLNGQQNHIEFQYDLELNREAHRKANIFAGELLIPLPQLVKTMKQLVLPTVKNLAKVFEVPNAVMLARLEYLGLINLCA